MKRLFTVSEVADVAGCSVSAVHRAANAGRLNGINIGKRRGPGCGGRERLFLKVDVESFLRKYRVRGRKARRARARRKDGRS